LYGGGEARDFLPGIESFPHLLRVVGAGRR
jgi:hypothetical protein